MERNSQPGREPRQPERRCSCGRRYTPLGDQAECKLCYLEKKRDAWLEGRERRQRREDALHRRLLRARPKVVADIYDLPSVAEWRRRNIDDALDGLVADGRLIESAHGKVVVRKRRQA